MKTLALFILAVSATVAFPASATFEWQPRPVNEAVTSYRLYSLTATGTNVIAAITSHTASVFLVDGLHVVAVSAVNARGNEGPMSSALYVFANSDTVVTVQNKPGAPIGLTIR